MLGYVHKHKKRISHLQRYHCVIYNKPLQAGGLQKGEATVIGKCGFIGFAELRVSMFCNSHILWPESCRLCPAPAPAPGQMSTVSRQLLLTPAQPAEFRDTQNQQGHTPDPKGLSCAPAAQYIHFTLGLPQAYGGRQDLSCI